MRIERAENDFNLTNYPPEPVSRELAEKRKAAIVKHTRDKYATPIAEVEDQFRALHAPAGPAANRHRSQRSKEEAQEVLANTVLPEPGDPPPVPDTSGQQFPAGFETGRGGEHHQELQSVIKRMSESYGFQAEIEKPLPDGGRVDVSLKSDELMLACEVSVTTVALRDHKRPEMSRGGLRLCLCSCFQSEETCPLEIKTLFGSIAGATQPGQSVRFERAAA